MAEEEEEKSATLPWPDSKSITRKKPKGGDTDMVMSPMFRFGLRLHLAPCRVLKVYDGDSLTIAWRANDSFLYSNCRMYGIDTPEMNSKVERHKSMAVECKRLMTDLLLDERMLVTTVGTTGLDKYGRPLIELYIDPTHTSQRCKATLGTSTSVNAWALANLPGCTAYFGKTKLNPDGDSE